jgi:hypothetical protein
VVSSFNSYRRADFRNCYAKMEGADTKAKHQSLVHRVTKKSKEFFSRNKKSRNSTHLEVPVPSQASNRRPEQGLDGQTLTPFDSPSENSFNISANESGDKSSFQPGNSKTVLEPNGEQPWAVSTKDNTYHYTDLPSKTHFRVLELLPGKFGDRIAFSLRNVKWSEKPPDYEAISYVWGDPNDVEQCIIDGQNFFITKSLYEALRNFRSEHTKRLLWADAVW